MDHTTDSRFQWTKINEKEDCVVLNPRPNPNLMGQKDETFPLSHKAAKEFCDRIRQQVELGYGFVPFIGAGLSAPSGVPLVVDVKPYLQRCIGLALGIAPDQIRPWNPRTDQWPPFVASPMGQSEWFDRIQWKIKDLRGDRDVPVLQEALGAIAEWRTALQFLSRLVVEQSGDGWETKVGFVLSEPKQEVVDACLRTILKGKRPTLGHRMLAALGGVMRLSVILTTNFDELIEDAFKEARNPLTVSDVHLGDVLPAWSAVSAQRSLVKMHGNSYSLRADYSLDGPPNPQDMHHFAEYIAARELQPGDTLRARNHLIIMGASARERRTTAFVRHAWRMFGPELKVFWICHTDDDVRQVLSFCKSYGPEIEEYKKHDSQSGGGASPPGDSGQECYWGGACILRHTNPGLLFSHVFQWIRGTIPTTGVIFPSTPRLSIPPLADRASVGGKSSSRSQTLGSIVACVEKLIGSDQSPQPRLLVVWSKQNVPGVTGVCAEVFEKFETQAMCVWLDLNDVTNVDNLFEQLIDTMYYRLGDESWLPIYVAPDCPSMAEEIRRLAATTTRPWIIFLNARETPGCNDPEFKKKTKAELPNGWIDDPAEMHLPSFVSLLTQLCPPNAGRPSITVVVMCRGLPADEDTPGNEMCKALRARCVDKHAFFPLKPAADGSETDEGESFEDKIACECFEWAHPANPPLGRAKVYAARLRFLRRLVLAQVSAPRTPLGPHHRQR